MEAGTENNARTCATHTPRCGNADPRMHTPAPAGTHDREPRQAQIFSCSRGHTDAHARLPVAAQPRGSSERQPELGSPGGKRLGTGWASPLGSQAQCLQTWGPRCPPAAPRAPPGPPAWPSADFRDCRGHPRLQGICWERVTLAFLSTHVWDAGTPGQPL